MALRTSSEALRKDELDCIFECINDSSVVSKLWKPKAGEIFVFRSSGTDDWRADGYRWKQNGYSFIPNKDKVYKKTHFRINTANGLSSDFQKFVYRKCQGGDSHVIVQYVGTEESAVDFPHGNSKSGVNFLPAAASLRTALSSGEHSYKDLVLSTRDEPVQFQPRNNSQLKYYKESTQRICKDTLLALHEFAYMVSGFVWSITTYPDLVVVCCLPQLQALVVRLCQSDHVLLSYDATFNVGEFYLSILCVQLQCFTSKPCIPLAFMLHDRKCQWIHDQFFQHVRRHCSGLRNAVIVVDGEASISKAIRSSCTDWKVAMCSNHIIRDVECWLKKHCASPAEIPVYKTSIRELLQCQTEVALVTKQAQSQSTWNAAFVAYYNENVDDRMKLAYNGHLRSLQLHCDNVTTNMSKSISAALKNLQKWTEVSVDMMVFTLYKLQLASHADLVRSLKGFGPMEFVSSFNKDTISDIDALPDEPAAPELIVDSIRSRLENRESNHERVPPVCALLTDDLHVCHVPDHKIFSVTDPTGVAHAVRLFPKETCTCPANSTCCHIMAAKKSIGLETVERRAICLTQLRKNSRKRLDKRSGRKRARVGDTSFASAPDSSVAEPAEQEEEVEEEVVEEEDAMAYLRLNPHIPTSFCNSL